MGRGPAQWAQARPVAELRISLAGTSDLGDTAGLRVLASTSYDDGKTWSAPRNVTAQVKRPEWCYLLQGPGRGISMADGTRVFAAQYQDAERMPHATLLVSRDQGATWSVPDGPRHRMILKVSTDQGSDLARTLAYVPRRGPDRWLFLPHPDRRNYGRHLVRGQPLAPHVLAAAPALGRIPSWDPYQKARERSASLGAIAAEYLRHPPLSTDCLRRQHARRRSSESALPERE